MLIKAFPFAGDNLNKPTYRYSFVFIISLFSTDILSTNYLPT